MSISYKLDETKITFIENDGGFYLSEGYIKTDNVKLYKNCFIGIMKEDFLYKFNLMNIHSDTLLVKNEDQTYEYYFIFNEEDKLTEISLFTEE